MKVAGTEWGEFGFWENDGIGQSIAAGYFWEPHMRPFFDEVPVGSVVVDVGSNLGWWTIYAARRGCHVFSFEACPEVFELLKNNVERNVVGIHVSMFPLALYERCELLRTRPLGQENPANQIMVEGKLDTSQCRNSGSFSLQPGQGSSYDMYAVPLDYFHLRGVSLIKVDTEGLDLFVLKGARHTVEMNHPIIAYEYLEGPGSPRVEDYEKLMNEYDYRTEQIYEDMGGAHRDFIARPK